MLPKQEAKEILLSLWDFQTRMTLVLVYLKKSLVCLLWRVHSCEQVAQTQSKLFFHSSGVGLLESKLK